MPAPRHLRRASPVQQNCFHALLSFLDIHAAEADRLFSLAVERVARSWHSSFVRSAAQNGSFVETGVVTSRHSRQIDNAPRHDQRCKTHDGAKRDFVFNENLDSRTLIPDVSSQQGSFLSASEILPRPAPPFVDVAPESGWLTRKAGGGATTNKGRLPCLQPNPSLLDTCNKSSQTYLPTFYIPRLPFP